MANDGHEQNGISRRDFTARIGAATAGLAIGALPYTTLFDLKSVV